MSKQNVGEYLAALKKFDEAILEAYPDADEATRVQIWEGYQAWHRTVSLGRIADALEDPTELNRVINEGQLAESLAAFVAEFGRS